MNNGAFGENFPYSNFHDLNMDWIIKIAKDFLDQYTHIQELIDNGEASITELTNEKLANLTTKAEELEALLNQWYNTHSQDIANQLATAIQSFTTNANSITNEVIASIPEDYTTLSNTVTALNELAKHIFGTDIDTDIAGHLEWVQGSYGAITNYSEPETNSNSTRIRTEYTLAEPIDGFTITSTGKEFQYAVFDASGNELDHDLAWRNESSTTYANGIKIIRLLVRNSDNSDIIPAYGYNSIDIKPFITHSLKKITSDIDYLQTKIINNDNMEYYNFHWRQGGYGNIHLWDNVEPNNNGARIRTEVVLNCPSALEISIDEGYEFIYGAFDSDNNQAGYIITWRSEPDITDLDVKTLRISIRRSDNSGIYPTSGNVIHIKPIKNNHIRLKVGTYNIGHFSYGVSPYYLNTDFDEKSANYRKFFEETDCDIWGIQENNAYLDDANSGDISTDSYLYNYLYPFAQQITNNNAIKSRIRIYNKKSGSLPISNRSYISGIIRIENKDIFVICSHLTPNPGSTEDTAREAEAEELIRLLKEHEYAILFADFNAQTTSFYDIFTNEGFKIANGGYKPFQFTYSLNPNDYSSDTPSSSIRFLDNIVTTANIVINNVQALKEQYAKLSSDHIPLIADLTIID